MKRRNNCEEKKVCKEKQIGVDRDRERERYEAFFLLEKGLKAFGRKREEEKETKERRPGNRKRSGSPWSASMLILHP